jgi:lipoyl-dependent peroxiredoxin subunit D
MNYEEFKSSIPEFAKDIRLNLDAVVLRSSLDPVEAGACAVAAAYAAGVGVTPFADLAGSELQAALTAAALMGMNNVWYPYVEMTEDAELKGLPASLRMNAYATAGGTTKARFELYALTASIVGKCHFCVKSHYDLLKAEGYSTTQLRDVGRIAAVVAAAAKAAKASLT